MLTILDIKIPYTSLIINYDSNLFAYSGRYWFTVDQKTLRLHPNCNYKDITTYMNEVYNEYQTTLTMLSRMLQTPPCELPPRLWTSINFNMKPIPDDAESTMPILRYYEIRRKRLLLCGDEKNTKWMYWGGYSWKYGRSYSNKTHARYTITLKCEQKLIGIIKGINVLRAFLCEDVKRLILLNVLHLIAM